jgi:hypothetical protein
MEGADDAESSAQTATPAQAIAQPPLEARLSMVKVMMTSWR